MLLVLATSLPFANPTTLFLVAVFLMVGYWLHAQSRLLDWLASSWRLKWLLLSILILYGWFTPGIPLIAEPELNWPSREGLVVGLQRALVLVLLVGAVKLALLGIAREQLAAGLIWMAQPLQWLGVNTQKIAVRLALCLDAVPELEQRLRQQSAVLETNGPESVATRSSSSRLIDKAVDLIHSLEVEAQQMPSAQQTTSSLNIQSASPPMAQWLWPVLLVVILFASMRLVA